ncbi:MAG TPA: zinc ribbon domain-containing protein [Methylomirabilota bacterium]|nr:zinc ribbon domain-containing protein [Methylomirabilota bacterium]
MSDAFNERLRLIRFRQKRERAKFREELRVIPRWLVRTCVALYVLAIVIGLAVNIHNFQTNGPIFPDETLRNQPVASCALLLLVITAGAIALSIFLFMLGYVYRDAKRRDMNPILWTLLVLILSPAYMFIGLIIYLLVREPLPYNCPQCATTVNARFNFCPNCKYNLHPACPQCQREVSDDDKFCPFCATELTRATKVPTNEAAPNNL